jgi:hypothetical protein
LRGLNINEDAGKKTPAAGIKLRVNLNPENNFQQ